MNFLPLLFLVFISNMIAGDTGKCAESLGECNQQNRRYLIYGVNFGEGFNLRRDVYLRIANVVRQLREKGHNYTLVLPLWFTPHWRREDRRPAKWSEFFDLPSLNRFVPVIEYEDFIKENGKEVESLLYLQHYAEGWEDGQYRIKYDLRPCLEAENYFEQAQNKNWKSFARSLREAEFQRLRCLSMQGESSTLVKAILELEAETKTLFVDRVETILHDDFGGKFYWQARRSMRYADQLCAIGDRFRRDVLGSTDEADKTSMAPKWEDQKPAKGSAIGGDYLCVHWRRRDFIRAHSGEVPSVEGTARQISQLLGKLRLQKVFLSTDAEQEEYRELSEKLADSKFQVARFSNTSLSDGAVSIVDQWICSHARHFIGTHVSTFSFRIHEDREILGFDPATTFNRLCPDHTQQCEQPAKWTIVYE